ncbi:hypothetical protein AUR04nite_19430 [Glutamicibacter uratoxydans]|uniref:Uncharacterized protein n=1 Tax=Glutamicibacter uratoxydans TaxID=43667 RepID=A0A4Y4DVH5_GLUUR|nr:hypothetical protein [Glutamicibacter uratoxydans]GED06411.1 hypothetical protein AUR04nite_19430 [Glutamicibacter uratoxydans]
MNFTQDMLVSGKHGAMGAGKDLHDHARLDAERQDHGSRGMPAARSARILQKRLSRGPVRAVVHWLTSLARKDELIGHFVPVRPRLPILGALQLLDIAALS